VTPRFICTPAGAKGYDASRQAEAKMRATSRIECCGRTPSRRCPELRLGDASSRHVASAAGGSRVSRKSSVQEAAVRRTFGALRCTRAGLGLRRGGVSRTGRPGRGGKPVVDEQDLGGRRRPLVVQRAAPRRLHVPAVAGVQRALLQRHHGPQDGLPPAGQQAIQGNRRLGLLLPAHILPAPRGLLLLNLLAAAAEPLVQPRPPAARHPRLGRSAARGDLRGVGQR